MKRIVAIMLILSMLMLVSCGGDGEVVPDATDTAETTDETTFAPDDTTDAGTDSVISEVTVEPYYLTDISERNIVCVKTSAYKSSNTVSFKNANDNHIKAQIAFIYYPLEEFELVNEIELSDDFEAKIDNGEYTDYLVELEGETKYNGDELLSVVYTGMYNCKTAAHPNNMCFSINLNDDAERVYFKDIYNIGDELYEVFADYAQADIDARSAIEGISVRDMLCTKDSFISGIENESTVNYYMTDDSVGFIYPVPHAMGDYLTVEIPLGELEEFKK